MIYSAFKETTETQYDYALEVLPPEVFRSGGFLVGEPVTHRRCLVTHQYCPTFDAYIHVRDKYYTSTESLTVAEFNHMRMVDFMNAIVS